MFFGQNIGDIFLLSKFPNLTSNDSFDSSVAASYPQAVEFHCGIFIDNQSVIHSTPQNGVVEEKLIDVIKHINPDKVDILSVEQPILMKEKAIKWAKNQLGCGYNHLFTPYNDINDEKKPIYCSQLIIEAYKNANNGLFIFEEILMRFTDDKVIINFLLIIFF